MKLSNRKSCHDDDIPSRTMISNILIPLRKRAAWRFISLVWTYVKRTTVPSARIDVARVTIPPMLRMSTHGCCHKICCLTHICWWLNRIRRVKTWYVFTYIITPSLFVLSRHIKGKLIALVVAENDNTRLKAYYVVKRQMPKTRSQIYWRILTNTMIGVLMPKANVRADCHRLP